MKRIPLLLASITLSLTLSSCEAIARKTGMSGLDLLMITSNAASRAQAAYDATQADIAAAKARQRASEKNPVGNLQP